jgi:hypothetical protein
VAPSRAVGNTIQQYLNLSLAKHLTLRVKFSCVDGLVFGKLFRIVLVACRCITNYAVLSDSVLAVLVISHNISTLTGFCSPDTVLEDFDIKVQAEM